MAELSFKCPGCEQPLEAPEELAGETVECPTCGRPIAVPSGKASSVPATALPGKESAACPGCGASLEPGVVLCVTCGYHLKLGKKIETQFS
jgi:DNA-directed RNA polymerase subunit RPC12/RpoP